MQHKKGKKLNSFTLTELLTALAIIGVCAVLLISLVIPCVRKAKLESQLVSFFIRINSALRTSYAESGIVATLPRKDYTYKENKDWLENNILPYIHYKKIEKCNDPNIYRRNAACVEMHNGTLFEFVVDNNGADFLYFPHGKWFNIEDIHSAGNNVFAFQFSKRLIKNSDKKIVSQLTIDPYTMNWDGTMSDLYNDPVYGCTKGTKKFFCAKIIELNGWKIPKEYPVR